MGGLIVNFAVAIVACQDAGRTNYGHMYVTVSASPGIWRVIDGKPCQWGAGRPYEARGEWHIEHIKNDIYKIHDRKGNYLAVDRSSEALLLHMSRRDDEDARWTITAYTGKEQSKKGGVVIRPFGDAYKQKYVGADRPAGRNPRKGEEYAWRLKLVEMETVVHLVPVGN